MINRRGLLGTLFSLPLLKGAAETESFTSYKPAFATLKQGKLATFSVTRKITNMHKLKWFGPGNDLVTNELGLGVIYLDTRGIFTEEKDYSNLRIPLQSL